MTGLAALTVEEGERQVKKSLTDPFSRQRDPGTVQLTGVSMDLK